MHVELRPHTGINVATKKPVDLKQDRIFVDGDHVGYVSRKADAPINLIRHDFEPALKEAVRAAVIAKYGGTAQRIGEPVAIPDELQDSGGDFDELD